MTRANKLCLLTVLAVLSVRSQEPTSEITSNDLWRVAGNGDTLWFATSKGLNFTTGLRDAQISWNGFRDISAWAMAFGDRTLAACRDDASERLNSLWLYRHRTATALSIRPELPTQRQFAMGRDSIQPFFLAGDIAYGGTNLFWVAYGDAGLGRLNTDYSTIVFHYPGMDRSAFSPKLLQPSPFDTAFSAISVAVDDSAFVWLGCNRSLWRFNPRDTTWLRITAPPLAAATHLDLACSGGGSQCRLYTISVNNADTIVYRYSAASGQAHPLTGPDRHPTALAAATRGRLYVLADNAVALYRDTLSPDTPPSTSPEISAETFRYRRFPAGIEYPLLHDLHYSTSGPDTVLALATSEGLFYSIDEHADERNETALRRVFREKVLESGLTQTYAYPSILNDSYSAQRAVIAYNLAENDDVTIDIFDFNMDHVVRILDSRPRTAGKNRIDGSGRSTLAGEDYWDGTFNNAGGMPVAAGVYYYRITTGKGQRAFGKIIVAKSAR